MVMRKLKKMRKDKNTNIGGIWTMACISREAALGVVEGLPGVGISVDCVVASRHLLAHKTERANESDRDS